MTHRPKSARIGPAVIAGIVPAASLRRLPRTALHDAWSLVGPTAERNLDALPLWMVIAAAYLEGIGHGAGAATDAGNVLHDLPPSDVEMLTKIADHLRHLNASAASPAEK